MCIADEELDNMILEARKSLDQSYRKTLYKACLDTIVDWATEVPVYQRQNAIIFSTERVKMETVLPDITTFYGWLNGIQNMELKDFVEKDDFLPMEGEKNASAILREGDFLICYPSDGHRTAVQVGEPETIKKCSYLNGDAPKMD